MQLDSCSAIFFDFDGVLVDSLEIKTNAYRQIFKPYGSDVVEQIVTHHQLNAGISRVDKIRYAHQHILDIPYSENAVAKDVMEYSSLVFEKVVAANWIPGAKDFVEQSYLKFPMFIISGTPQVELREIVKRRNMQHYFREVLGSPLRKTAHIRALVERYELTVENCFFIGDALTDYYAAQETGMPFIGIEGETELPEGTQVLPDCSALMDSIAEFNNRFRL